jgi:hypothetical protein
MKKLAIIFAIISGLFSILFFYMFAVSKALMVNGTEGDTTSDGNVYFLLGLVALIFAIVWPITSKKLFNKDDK